MTDRFCIESRRAGGRDDESSYVMSASIQTVVAIV